MENCLRGFLGEILARPSKWFEKSAQKSVQNIRTIKSVQRSAQKVRAKQIRANGFLIATPQVEKPKIVQQYLLVLFFCKLASTTALWTRDLPVLCGY